MGDGLGVVVGDVGNGTGMFGVFDVEDAQVASAFEQTVGGAGVFDGDDAVGDFDKGITQVVGRGILGGKIVGQVFSSAA